MQVQIVIVCRNFILPWVFRLAEYFEKHHPRTALKLMLIRCATHTHTYTHTHTCTHARMLTHARTHACSHMHTHTLTHAGIVMMQ